MGDSNTCAERLHLCRCLGIVFLKMNVLRVLADRGLTFLPLVTALLLATQATSAPLTQISQRPSARVCPPAGQLDASFLLPFIKNELLDLSNCGVDRVDPDAFRGFHHLKRLALDGNNLRELHPDTFADCSVLFELDLSRNVELSPPASQSFLNIPSLEVLNLQNCGIQGASVNFFKMVPNLVKVNLNNNPLCNTVNCDNIRDIFQSGNEGSNVSGVQEGQTMKVRKPGRTLLVSEQEYIRWSSDPEYKNRRQNSSLLTILVVGTVLSLSMIGIGITIKSRAKSTLKHEEYHKLRYDPEEIIISSERENSQISHRTTWKQHMEIMYVLLTYSSEYGVCPVKI